MTDDWARMTPEELRNQPTNPYPQGSYLNATWNLERAGKNLTDALEKTPLVRWMRSQMQAKPNRWAAFTDDELAVLDICTAIPARLREDQRRIETELVAEIHARNIRRKT